MQSTDFLMRMYLWAFKLGQVRPKYACSVTDANLRQEMSGMKIRYYTILTANDYCYNQLKWNVADLCFCYLHSKNTGFLIWWLI